MGITKLSFILLMFHPVYLCLLFIKVHRSDGTWTYAIVANFPVETGEHASIRFVTDKKGSTKSIKKHKWADSIRLVNTRI